jgi:hypothetical protein
MKKYKVTITETSRMVVEVEADSLADAEEIAEDKWNNGEYILDADNFCGADFHARLPEKDRGSDR